MNKFLKVIVAFLGGINVVFEIFLPIALILTIISIVNFNSFSIWLLIIIGILSTIYRAIKFWVVD